ncbi:hypothetical protein AOXY_G35598 [Acipenser oxyrinchus oxyrinchus]|uniref:Uncharacterized protein n=1 Tax=Acipenser oxyrinchus oxyrinchus TaxID=40147 RepID=A0AAD8CHY4_ACIOX|nr:hypothetical protein AOXY_G35765 [Acipenser oxyrinchus oxyrinchus]KAK1147272.1 hypothetical protein AOXY_G35598 [Acipenser oxyrinchus oxyrinchus]
MAQNSGMDIDMETDDLKQKPGHTEQLEESRSDDVFTKLFSEREGKLQGYLQELESIADSMVDTHKSTALTKTIGRSAGALSKTLAMSGLPSLLTLGVPPQHLQQQRSGQESRWSQGPIVSIAETSRALDEKKVRKIFQKYAEELACVKACLEASETEQKGLSDQTGLLEDMKSKPTSFISGNKVIKVLNNPALKKTAKSLLTGKMGKSGMNVESLATGAQAVSDISSLYNGSREEVAKKILERVSELRSELDSYRELHDTLGKGQQNRQTHTH